MKLIYKTGSNPNPALAAEDLIRLFQRTKNDTKDLLERAADKIMADAIPLTPMDTGALRESAIISEVEEEGDTLSIGFGFGNGSVDYATLIHEDLEPKHWKTANTGPKFLEKAIQENEESIKEIFMNGFKISLSGEEQ